MLVCFLTSVSAASSPLSILTEPRQLNVDDYDPLDDITITVDILAIRALDKIDLLSDPDFFITVFINDAEFISPVWNDTSYLYNCYSVTADVPDDNRSVDVVIHLSENDGDTNTLCDISKYPNNNGSGLDVHLHYDISIGRWSGDNNNVGDVTGYGRVCGCADGSIYKNENDCELWFNIYQNDFDNDGLPYWIETNVYGTDPTIDDSGQDVDFDGIPIEWEHRFGFNPLVWADHTNMDSDMDSLNNIEEFLTYNFGSDPFRKDVFLEIDYMQESNGDVRYVSNDALELVKNPFHRRNIVSFPEITSS
jgi:hypothetical protein